jgi:hypothetical protein
MKYDNVNEVLNKAPLFLCTPSKKTYHQKRWMNVLIEICPSFFLPDGEKSFMSSPREGRDRAKKQTLLFYYHIIPGGFHYPVNYKPEGRQTQSDGVEAFSHDY